MKSLLRAAVLAVLWLGAAGAQAEEDVCVVPLVKHLVSVLPTETVEDVLNLYIALGEALATCGHLKREDVREREIDLEETTVESVPVPTMPVPQEATPTIVVRFWLNDLGYLSASIASEILIPRHRISLVVQFGNRTMRFCNSDMIPPDGLAVRLHCAGSAFEGFNLADINAIGIILNDNDYYSCARIDEGRWDCSEHES